MSSWSISRAVMAGLREQDCQTDKGAGLQILTWRQSPVQEPDSATCWTLTKLQQSLQPTKGKIQSMRVREMEWEEYQVLIRSGVLIYLFKPMI